MPSIPERVPSARVELEPSLEQTVTTRPCSRAFNERSTALKPLSRLAVREGEERSNTLFTESCGGSEFCNLSCASTTARCGRWVGMDRLQI